MNYCYPELFDNKHAYFNGNIQADQDTLISQDVKNNKQKWFYHS